MQEKFTRLILRLKINDSFFCPCVPYPNFIFKLFSTDVQFSLSCIHFALGLLTFTNPNEAFKGYSEICMFKH